jgi:hypothetical protein
MPIQKAWVDPRTGATYPQAFFVLANTQFDTQSRRAGLNMAVYAGIAQYSAGKEPLVTQDFEVTGSVYMVNFDANARSLSQAYVAGLPQFSGGVVV